MIQCESCRRHHRHTDDTCPFCRSTTSPVLRAMSLFGGVVTTVVLSACYGTFDDKYTYTDSSDSGDSGIPTDPTTPTETGSTGDTGTTDSSGTTGDTGTPTGTTGDTGTPPGTTGDTGTPLPGTTGDTGVPVDTGTTTWTGGSGDTGVGQLDADGDGFFTPFDCNDADPLVNPDYPEQCADGIDNDCDGWVDADDPRCF